MLKLEQLAKWSIDKIGFDVLPIVYPKYNKLPINKPNQFFGQEFIEQNQPSIKEYQEGSMIYHQYTKEKDKSQKYDMEYPYFCQNTFFRDISQQIVDVTHRSPKIAVIKGEGIAKSIRYELENNAEVDLVDTKLRNGEFLNYTNSLNKTNVNPQSVDGISFLYNHKDTYDVVDATSYHFEKQLLYVHPSLYAIKPGGIFIHTIQQQITFFKQQVSISPYRQRVQNMGINFGNDVAYHYIENCFSRVNEIAGMLDKHVEPILHATTFNIENDIQLVFRVREGKKQLKQVYFYFVLRNSFTDNSDSNLIRNLCSLYHAMLSNLKKDLSQERRKSVLIILFKIIKRDDADIIHLELLHSIATVYQPDQHLDAIVLSNKALQFIIGSLNGEYQEQSLKILVKMSASDSPDLLRELLFFDIREIFYIKLEDKVKIHRRCALQILANLCYNNCHITNAIVQDTRFPRILLRYMSDIERAEKKQILRAMNNIMSTGDDLTFKKIVDLGWAHMMKTQFEQAQDNSILLQIVIFLMRLVIHSNETSDIFVKDIIQDLLCKGNGMKKLVEKYYNQAQDQEIEEQLNKLLLLLK